MRKNYKVLNDCRDLDGYEVLDIILQERGIEDVDEFLNPTEDNLLPLDSFKRIHEAYERVNKAIQDNENIMILADTDVDGITSGAIMTRYLKNFSDRVYTCIDEGKQHGLIGQDLSKFENSHLVIIVDSLDKDESQYRKLRKNGSDVIVLDHHAINPEVPYDDVCILVSSQRGYENTQLSGAGVCWKFCKYMDEQYLTDYADELMDLAACGLVADMMDMTVMENRYIVSKGLEKIYNPAIKKIVGGFEFNSTAIAYSIAPLVNAANRINKNEVALLTFLDDEKKTVTSGVKDLKKYKEFQNEEVSKLMSDVLKQCEEQKDRKMIVTYIDTPYGISGLLGNKLLEKYQKPILVLKDTGDSYSGSMRAVGVEDFRKICNDSGLAKADGHELASGISIKKENMNKFISYIEETLPELKFDESTEVDIRINVYDINRVLIDCIKKIDRVSGTNFKPVKVFIDGITDYTIGMMSDYKHLVIKPNDYTMIIKWNFDGSFDEMEDHSMMNDELEICCSLDSGFLGRNFYLKAICDEIREAV